MINLMLGDCLDRMKEIPDGSVDLTVTSPPYDNLRTYNNTLEWGEHVWKPVLQELFRVTKQGCVVVWVVGDATIKGSETGTSFRQALYAKEIGFNLHDTMIWSKPSPMPRDTRIPRYWQAFEYMFVFSKGKPNHFSFLTEKTKHAGEMRMCYSRKNDGTLRLDRKEKTSGHKVKETKPRCNVWEIQTKAMKNHPATFPIQLANDHIISWSNEGDTVLDCFMGSGTTGLAAKNLNRKFIGIEKDEKYFEIAKKRIGV